MNYSDTYPTQASIEQENDRSLERLAPFREALRAKEEAEAAARVARDSYVAATLGLEPGWIAPGGGPMPESLRKVEAIYLHERMVQAALHYADAANKAAEALERYEALIVEALANGA